MRTRTILLLLLAAPAAHAQQIATPPDAARGSRRVESSVTLPSLEPRILPAHADSLSATELRQAARPQPSGRDFLYQIALTAVGALVSALVWKAVF